MPEGFRTERRDPIPPGVYWIDADNPHKGWRIYEQWKAKHKDSVIELRRKTHNPSWWLDADTNQLWVLFKVTKPTPRWRQPKGLKGTWISAFPTAAKPATKKSDTVKRPEKKGTAKYWEDETKGVVTPYTAGLTTGIGGLALLLLLANSLGDD